MLTIKPNEQSDLQPQPSQTMLNSAAPPSPAAAIWRKYMTAYGFAIAITILTLQTRSSLAPWIGERPVFILFMLPIIFSAYVGGLGPGLLSTAICAGGVYYLLLAKAHNLLFFEGSLNLWQWVMLMINGGLVSVVVEALHRSRRRIEIESRLRQQEDAEKKLAEEKFAREQARFKLIFNALPIGIAFHTVHPDGSCTRIINDAHPRICGITRDQYNEPGIYERITHPEDRDLHRPFQAEVEAGLRKQYSMEKRFVHADGKVVWVNFYYQRERHPDGTYEELTTVTDITERKLDMSRQQMLEEQLRQSQKMEAIGQLAGGVAHDFNNIMAVIQMQVELFRMNGDVSAEQATGLDEILGAANRGANLTRQLLLFSRRQRLEPRDLDLSDSIAGMAKMLRRILGEDIQTHFKYAPQPLFIHADAGMMDQLLMNLTLNSRDAMPDGGQLVIETAAVDFDELAALQSPQAYPGSFARLSVCDTGCGIRPEVLPRIFEPFFTTKDVGKGTGLGLATVFSIVQQHQGWINVASKPGGGTTFDIYLPRVAKSSASPAEPAAPMAAVTGGSETILLVEDDDALRASVRQCLSQLGYRLLEAASGTAALRLWHQHRSQVDLLLTDLIMPGGMTGKELGECLQREDPKLKVIYASGYSADLLAQDFRPTPGTTFLAKPFPAQALAQAVRACLDKK